MGKGGISLNGLVVVWFVHLLEIATTCLPSESQYSSNANVHIENTLLTPFEHPSHSEKGNAATKHVQWFGCDQESVNSHIRKEESIINIHITLVTCLHDEENRWRRNNDHESPSLHFLWNDWHHHPLLSPHFFQFIATGLPIRERETMEIYREVPFIEWNDTDPVIDVVVPFQSGDCLSCYSLKGSIGIHV